LFNEQIIQLFAKLCQDVCFYTGTLFESPMFLHYLVPQGQYWHHYQQGQIHQRGTAEESKTVHHDE